MKIRRLTPVSQDDSIKLENANRTGNPPAQLNPPRSRRFMPQYDTYRDIIDIDIMGLNKFFSSPVKVFQKEVQTVYDSIKRARQDFMLSEEMKDDLLNVQLPYMCKKYEERNNLKPNTINYRCDDYWPSN